MTIDPEIAARVFGDVTRVDSLQAMGFTLDTAGFRNENLQPCISVACPPVTDVEMIDMNHWSAYPAAVRKCPDGCC